MSQTGMSLKYAHTICAKGCGDTLRKSHARFNRYP